MLFGSNRDFNLLVNINRELLKDIVEQEILYYKFSIKDTEVNIYGEGLVKSFLEPLKLNCWITRGDQVVAVDEFGPDLTRDVQFALLRRDLEEINVVPEVGDILNWQEDYYVVDNVRENQLFMGRDKSYNLTDYGSQFGTSVSLILETHMTRREQTGITFAQNEEY